MSGFWPVGSGPQETRPQTVKTEVVVPKHVKLIMATSNPHKVKEVAEIIAPYLPDFDPDSLVAAGTLGLGEPVEDGTSFAANALIKARYVYQKTAVPVIADDSGLAVDVMGGAPGIFSARWCGRHGDDQANLDLLLSQLTDVKDQDRGAAFVCAAALVAPGMEKVCQGLMGGHLTHTPQGAGGFGYDPIFVATGQDRTNAQLSRDEKNAISHRFKAFRDLAPEIGAALARA